MVDEAGRGRTGYETRLGAAAPSVTRINTLQHEGTVSPRDDDVALVGEADDPRTPTKARPQPHIQGDSQITPADAPTAMQPFSKLAAPDATAKEPSTRVHNAPSSDQEQASENEADGGGNVSGVSAASSPDDNRPILNRVSVALQRGDSTSSDSSTSNLSRASSSSSVYATPFRMTPFRTPAGVGSRAGSTAGERNSYFPALVPPRFGNRGYSSARSSFTGSLPARNFTNGTSSTTVVVQDVTAPAVLPAVAEANGVAFPSGHRPSGSNATIGPTAAAMYAAETRTSPRASQTRLPSAVNIFSANGASHPGVVAPANGVMRSPPSPGAELMLQGGAAPQVNLLRPVRPGLGSRSTSNASIGNNFHKRAADFDLGEILGEGSYSTVFLATDKFPPHRQYALKVLDKKHIIKERKVKYVNVEKETLARLDRHPGIVRLYWTFHDERSLYFVLELASQGEILKYIKEYGSFDTTSARFYAAQVICAVHHMHNKGVVRRDLKPEK